MPSREVFVSYSQPDRDTALAIVSHLEAHQMPCWVAPRDVPPATDWAEQIVEAIAHASVMVLVFSASANSSPQVRREVERAVHRNVRLLPFRVEDVMPSRSLEYFLSSQHWLDAFPPPMEPHYLRLAADVRALLGAGAERVEPAPLSTPAPQRAAAGEGLPDAVGLLRLETELARFIGPVARHLVRRAALRAAGTEQLLDDLGREIDSDSERRAFLSAAHHCLRAR